MDMLTPHFTENEMPIINRYRIHLQLFFISNATTIQGRKLLPCVHEVQMHRTSIWEWPNQQAPTKQITLWKRACEHMNLHLRTHRLGTWIRKYQCWS